MLLAGSVFYTTLYIFKLIQFLLCKRLRKTQWIITTKDLKANIIILFGYFTTFNLIFSVYSAHEHFTIGDSTERVLSNQLSNNNYLASKMSYFYGDIVAPTFRTIKKLYISGSQQYTVDFLKQEILKKIVAEYDVPLKRIILVDLREEPHFMFGRNATVSVEGATADSYRGLSLKEIMRIENKFSQSLPNYFTEKSCAETLGVKYHRFAVTDVTRPEDSDVDEFVKFFKELKIKEKIEGEKYWLHFHCLAGKGRTTTFMSLFEMLQTAGPDVQSFEEILEDQHRVGGADLLNMWYTRSGPAWVSFLRNFYEYAKDQEHGYQSGKSWSEWVALKGISVFQEKPIHYSWFSLGRLFSETLN